MLAVMLALANTALIAIGVSGIEKHDRAGAAFIVMIVGSIPAVLTALVVGTMAGALADAPRWLRNALLIPPPLGLVAVLSIMFGLTSYFAVACIPTLAATLILERRTRAFPDLPAAVAR